MTTSAYPMPVEEIVAALRARVRDTGAVPSRNAIMGEFRVGAAKAVRVRDTLSQPGPVDPAGTDPTGDAEPDPTTTTGTDSIPVAGRPVDVPVRAVRGQAETPAPLVASEPDPAEPSSQATDHGHPVTAPVPQTMSGPDTAPAAHRSEPSTEPAEPRVSGPGVGRVRWRNWPLLLLAAPAFVAIWGGWVGLGKLAGFGEIVLLPGIVDSFTLDSSITLPIGVEAYAAYALSVWLGGRHGHQATRFAMWSAIGSLVLGMAGQIAYHLMTAAGMHTAPWWITAVVSSLPVMVLGCAAALAHLTHHTDTDTDTDTKEVRA